MKDKLVILFFVIAFFSWQAFSSQICPNSCLQCIYTATGYNCSLCQDGYYLTPAKICKRCNEGCKKCGLINSATPDPEKGPDCIECLDDYKNYNPSKNTCFACDSNCSTCFMTPTYCKTCKEGYTIGITGEVHACYKDSQLCLFQLLPNCYYCSGPQQCSTCKLGYTVNYNKKCTKCPSICKQCKFYDKNIIVDYFKKAMTITAVQFLDDYNAYMVQYADYMKYAYDWAFAKGADIKTYLPAGANYSLLGSKYNETPPTITKFQPTPYMDVLQNQLAYFYNAAIFNKMRKQAQNGIDLFIRDFSYTYKLEGKYPQFGIDGYKLNVGLFARLMNQLPKFKRIWWGSSDTSIINGDNEFNFDLMLPQCSSCADGSFFSYAERECYPCPKNCLTCESNDKCLTCQSGTSILTGSNICKPCNNPKCKSCKGDGTVCTSCFLPSYLTQDNKCVQCTAPCMTCGADPKVCKKCFPPFSILAFENGTCVRCAQDTCKFCKPENPSLCMQCIDGTSLVNGKCQGCPQKCVDCDATTGQCYKCQQRYALSSTDKKCLPCLSGCLICSAENPKVCLTCQKGTYKNEVGSCLLCKAACLQCENADKCTVYKQGLLMIGLEAIRCRPGCSKCSSQNPQICQACDQRFVLSETKCFTCGPGCLSCDISDVSKCLTCPPNRVLQGTTCAQCSQNCIQCTSSSVCKNCRMGFLIKDNKCVEAKDICSFGCVECSLTDLSTCTKCAFGFVLSPTNKCVKCVTNCGASCDASNPTMCTGCLMGFESLNGRCVKCSPSCVKCSNSSCIECVSGFQLFQNQTGSFCKRQCRYPCKTCDKTICSACATNFTLTNNICQPDITCGGLGCLFCPTGSFKAGDGSCKRCIANCGSCMDETACTVCRQGFFLQNKACVSCPQGAAVCIDATKSLLCKPGFVIQVVSIDITDLTSVTFSPTCKPCVSPCQECMILPSLCVVCVNDDYRLNGTTCLKKILVGAEIKFNVDYAAFLQTGQLQDILNKLAAKIPTALFVLTYIRQGSTIINIGGQPDDTSSVQSLSSTMSDFMSSGGLGVQILSSSVGIFQQDTPYVAPGSGSGSSGGNDQTKVGLIVGVVVGGVVLCIIIGIIIYKLRTIKQVAQVIPYSTQQLQQKENSKSIIQVQTINNSSNKGYKQTNMNDSKLMSSR